MPGSNIHNEQFRLAAAFVNYTGKSIFLTGKAGTGKTTFLKYIQETTAKKAAVVAPTGVAAINAGGVTIHSFFQLPFGCFIPSHQGGWHANAVNRQGLLQKVRFNKAKRELLLELELLIIDEVSMVRADMIDAIDTLLRHYRHQPHQAFGGVQILLIGDLFQLPPVTSTSDWDLLSTYYKSPFFFEAQVLQQYPPVSIELDKIYRQQDTDFIHILNQVRNNTTDKNDLNILNAHYKPGHHPAENEHYITLTTHNIRADAINQSCLEKLSHPVQQFPAVIKGDFNEKAYPADELLLLKEGAQVMFIKNDKGEIRRYYNGKIATIKSITEEAIIVDFPGEEKEMSVDKETWSNIRYNYNYETDELEEEELGSFTQYPIRLAWAITIHKSQGLTFEKAIIDAGDAFAPGQVYVALSRLVSLKGLILYSRVTPQCITTDERVVRYSADARLHTEGLVFQLREEQGLYLQETLVKCFNWRKITNAASDLYESYDNAVIPDKADAVRWASSLLQSTSTQEEIAVKFSRQLMTLLATARDDQYQQLSERVAAASGYFQQLLDTSLATLQEHIKMYKVKQRTKKYVAELSNIEILLIRKKQQLLQATTIAAGLQNGLAASALLEQIETQKEEVNNARAPAQKLKAGSKAPKGESARTSLAMFREGKSIESIATERAMSKGTIETHLADFVKTGELDINTLVPAQRLVVILDALQSGNGQQSLTAVREKTGNDYGFGEIKAVLNHYLREKEMAGKTGDA